MSIKQHVDILRLSVLKEYFVKIIRYITTVLLLIMSVSVLTVGVYAVQHYSNTIDGTIKVEVNNPIVNVSVGIDSEPLETYNRVMLSKKININELLQKAEISALSETENLNEPITKQITLTVTNVVKDKRVGIYFLKQPLTSTSLIQKTDIIYSTENPTEVLADVTLPSYTILDKYNQSTTNPASSQVLTIDVTMVGDITKIQDFSYYLYIEEYLQDQETNYEKTTSSTIVVPELTTQSVAESIFTSTTITQTQVNNQVDASANKIIIPEGIITIGANAFQSRKTKFDIILPNSLTSILDYAFDGSTGLYNIDLPNSLTTIGSYAFRQCSKLTSLVIPKNLTSASVGTNAFQKCYALLEVYNLSSVVLKPNNNSMGNLSYYSKVVHANKYENSRIIVQDGVKYYNYNNDLIALYPIDLNTNNVTLLENCSKINDYAFNECRNLEEILLPSKLTWIADYAFLECRSLISIHIPSSVTTLRSTSFYNCPTLETITMEENNKYTSPAGSNAIIEKSSLSLIIGCKSTIIPDNVVKISGSSFAGSGITSIVFPDSITKIGDFAFYRCPNLEFITFGNNITSIENSAFGYCPNIKNVVLPDSLTTISLQVFRGCEALETVTLGSYVTTIDSYAFLECKRLKTITLPSTVTTIGTLVFSSCNSLKEITILAQEPPTIGANAFATTLQKIYVPFGTDENYKENWSAYKTKIEALPENA